MNEMRKPTLPEARNGAPGRRYSDTASSQLRANVNLIAQIETLKKLVTLHEEKERAQEDLIVLLKGRIIFLESERDERNQTHPGFRELPQA